MEQDEVNQQRNLTARVTPEERQFPSVDDNSEMPKECSKSTEPDLCITREIEETQSQKSPKHSTRCVGSSTSESNVTTADSSSLPEYSSFYELKLEIPAPSTDEISEEASIQLAEHQGVFSTQSEDLSLKSSQDGNPSVSEETIDERDTALDYAQDGSAELSIRKTEELVSYSCVGAIDYNEQKYQESKDFKQEKKNEAIDNVLQHVTDCSQISEATVKRVLAEALEDKFFDSITGFGSGDGKCIIREPTVCEEDCSKPGSITSVPHAEVQSSKFVVCEEDCSKPGSSSLPHIEVKSSKFAVCKEDCSKPGSSTEPHSAKSSRFSDSGKSLESSIEEAREALEELNIANFGDSTNQKNGYQLRQITTSDNGSDYEEVSFNVNISTRHIVEVMRRMKRNHYIAEGNEEDLKMYSYCKYLFEKDYKIKVINNEGGTLCKNYPARIIVPYSNHSHSSAVFDPDVYKDLTMKSSGARCRDRFVTPTIFWNGKFICRSATLTVKKSAVYETATKSPPPKAVEADPGSGKRILKHVRAKSESFLHRTSKTAQAMFKLMDLDAMKQYREDDKKLLEYCQILHIADLMYEDKKKKFFISVSSSEKIYQESYTDFEILEMPYPGCKFFRRYYEAGRIPNGLIFDWTRSDVNAALKIPNTSNIELPAKEWDRYKEWDVVELTQNYMELILAYFMQGDMGILIHCISGWDRTPLFVALLRISLWADGLIHTSLNAQEMAYLTLAYDWYLFGHNLPGRVRHGEEIMHFCYNFLKYFTEDHFSATLMWNSSKIKAAELESENDGLVLLPFHPDARAQKIQQLREIVLELYDEHVSKVPA